MAFLAALTLAVPALCPAADNEKKPTMQTVDYHGWKNTLKLSNGDVELLITLDVGPRILSYKLAGGNNVLKEYPEQLGKAGESGWMIRGGHRLWVSPEDTQRTYTPDNLPVKHEVLSDGTVRLLPEPDAFGIQKQIDVKLAPQGSGVTLTHRLTNVGQKPTELAPWALTVMAPGGVEIIPFPPHAPHPGSASNAKSADDFGPNMELVLWPYFDFSDDRWTFGSKYITLRHKDRGPTKLGLAHREGWVAYLNGGNLFVKQIPFEKSKVYPDRGASYETFSNPDMVEMESLGPLVNLKPGESTELVERWSLFGGVGEVKTEADIDREIRSKIKD
ncbi:MAG TPA: hypothetical protein VFT74_00050 [Isosphaeraceae bacterium]|nr:hypothetical protein [Isosphaeraceae bacterium]